MIEGTMTRGPARNGQRKGLCLAIATTVLTTAIGVHAAPPVGGYQLLWSSQFNGTTLNPLKWNFGQPWGSNVPPQSDSIGEPGNVTVSNNTLNLTAQRQSMNGYNFTTGLVNTSGKLNFTYGYVEAQIQTPYTLGTWPAFWMLQNGWPPEMDIMEAPQQSYNNQTGSSGTAYDYYATYHFGSSSNPQSVGSGMHYTGVNEATSLNDYGMMWTPNSITFYFNGSAIYTVSGSTADIGQSQNMYLLLDLAVGGWPGEPPTWASFPATMQIKNVNIWQLAPSNMTMNWTGDGTTANWNSGGSWKNGQVPTLGSQTAVFGQTSATSTNVQWSNFQTAGNLVFNGGNTNYILGELNTSGLMLANDSGTATITANPYLGHNDTVSLNAELDLYNNTTIVNNLTNPIQISGMVYGLGALNVVNGAVNVGNVFSNTGGIAIDNGGTVNIYSGSIDTPTADVNISTLPGSAATLALFNSSSSINANVIRVGGYNGGKALYIQQAGTVESQTWFVIGQSANAAGTVDLNGGTLNIRTGGGTSGDLELGVFNASSGVLNITGTSSVRLWNGSNIVLGSRGTSGNGTVNQYGGSVSFFSDNGLTTGGDGDVILGRNGSTGIYSYNLNGGVLNANAIVSSSGTSNLNFNGGTLSALADNNAFISGLTSVTVQPQGGTIDTGGHVIGISEQIGGSGQLTFTGGGIITLNTASTYTGGTSVDGVTLVLKSLNGSPVGTGSLTISAGGILAGSGILTGPVSTVSSGTGPTQNGELAPGAGGLVVRNNLILADNSLLAYGTASGSVAPINVVGSNGDNGNVSLGRNAGVVISGALVSGVYHLISYTGRLDSPSGNIGSWTLIDSTIGNTPYAFSTSLNPGYVDLLVGTATVPEPAAIATLLLPLVFLALRPTRRKPGR